MNKPKNTVKRIGIVCNIKTNCLDETQGEFDEIETVEAIKKAIEKQGFNAIIIDATKDLPQELKNNKIDFAFNIAEGVSGRGREAHAPAILEYFNIPFVGSDVTTLSIALDKDLTKRFLSTFDVVSPKALIVTTPTNENDLNEITYPVIVKPNAEGSSKGIHTNCVAKNITELNSVLKSFANGEQLLIEQYVDGREFTVGLLGNGENVKVFEPMEIIFSKTPNGEKVYSYEVKKHFREHISYACPPNLPTELINQIKNVAKTIFLSLKCRDFARIDFRLSSDNKLYFIEANPLPGLAPLYSDYPMLADYCGVDYDSLVSKILFAAFERYGR